MVITEIELREMWRDGHNALPAFPPGTRFSPSAQDFIKDHKLEIVFAAAKSATIPSPQLQITTRSDQLPSSLPQLQITNSQLPSSLPQLQITTRSDQLPFSLETLISLTMLVAAESRRCQLPLLARRLDALAEYCLELRAAEQQGRDPAPLLPAPAVGGPDFAPGPTDHAILHWLNFLRAMARQAAAQASSAGSVKLAAALEQVSASAAGLGRQVQSGELGWNFLGDPSGRH